MRKHQHYQVFFHDTFDAKIHKVWNIFCGNQMDGIYIWGEQEDVTNKCWHNGSNGYDDNLFNRYRSLYI